MTSHCIICREEFTSTEDVSKITAKGLATLVSSSVARNDLQLAEKLENVILPLSLHTKCRKNYTRLSSIEANQPDGDSLSASTSASTTLRSCVKIFDIKNDCLFCGEEASEDVKQSVRKRKSISQVETIEFQKSLLKYATDRKDKLGDLIIFRVRNSIDLIAAEARYHRECRTNFFLTKTQQEIKRPRGRPVSEDKSNAFQKLCNYLEKNDECQYSMAELLEHMDTYLDGQEGYTTKHLQSKLLEHYGDKIIITSIPGKSNVVCFKDAAGSILHDNWYNQKCTDRKDERKRIVEMAASIIREDIRLTVYDCDTYPSIGVLKGEDELVPDTLKCFIQNVIKLKGEKQPIVTRRSAAIAHALIAACRPRSFISPLLLAIGIYLHRKYASRELIDILCSLSFAHSYRETQRYEYSLMADESPSYDLKGFVQFVFDNADFNVHSLDGHNTFHSMGGIACVTPAGISGPNTVVPRIHNIPSAATIGSFGRVPIKTYHVPAVPGLKSIIIKDVTIPSGKKPEFQAINALNSLWLMGYHIKASPCPSWSGFMQEALKGGIYDTSRIVVLPFINLDPNNLTTIYSALHFAQDLCKKYGINICPVTFDQPLYIKAVGIVNASGDLKKVIIRLGGFHLLMSFMGAIGNIMAGSGLEEMWESVYAKGSVIHMMSGHAYSRALRAHFLTQAALCQVLLNTPNCLEGINTEQLKTLYEDLLLHNKDPDDVIQEECVKHVTDIIKHLCDQAAEKGRTANLWINYYNQVSIMRLFIRAERTGDWWLHVHSVKQMLPYFHAAGHLAYAKSAHLYIQQMMELHHIMPEKEYKQFTEAGYFTIRRSDKFWDGIFSDQTIEQFLMRLLKTSGGMTRGRGITDSTLTRWVHALPKCVPICNELESFTLVHSGTSDQHKDLRPASQSRDRSDLDYLVQWLEAHPPFVVHDPDVLFSLATGIMADASVNCDAAHHIGQCSMKKMAGKTYSELTLRRKDKVKSLAAMKNTIKLRGVDTVINPSLMFNRITCILNTSTEMETFLQYELTPQPPSLFVDGEMRKTPKSTLGIMLKSMLDNYQCTVPDNAVYVVDGGYLLHAVIWPKPATYQDVCDVYKTYISKHYHVGATVVFDGYDGPPSTKLAEQNRRAKYNTSANIVVTPNLPTSTSQVAFLGNKCNKSRLIQILSSDLKSIGITVKQAESDADELIVSTALELSKSDNDQPVVVVGTDTDLLAMLVARATSSMDMFMLYQSKPVTLYSIKQLQQALGSTRQHILFIHAITGCDTTSALYGQGKVKALKLALKNDANISSHMDVFAQTSSTHEDIATAGELFLLKLYCAEKFPTLNKYRHVAYKRSVAKKSPSSTFTLAILPPTSAAAEQHSYRVYLQVQQWLGRYLPPTEWGWKMEENKLIVISTNQPAAPQTLLHLVSCGCGTGCGNACGCRKAGMVCTEICINCMGQTCSNTATSYMAEEEDN